MRKFLLAVLLAVAPPAASDDYDVLRANARTALTGIQELERSLRIAATEIRAVRPDLSVKADMMAAQAGIGSSRIETVLTASRSAVEGGAFDLFLWVEESMEWMEAVALWAQLALTDSEEFAWSQVEEAWSSTNAAWWDTGF